MQILIYKGNSQYDAFDSFNTSLKNALQHRGHNVDTFDLIQENTFNKLLEIFTVKKYDLIIGINGIGCYIKIGEELIYNVIKTFFLGIFVDHPIYHMSRLSDHSYYFMASFVDKDHVDFLQNTLPDNQALKFFMPLSGEKYKEEIKNLDEYKTLKDIDILFTGSNFGIPEKNWKNVEYFPCYILDEIAEELINNDYISVEDAQNKIFNKYKIKFSSISKAQLSNILSLIVNYVRQYKRDVILKKIFQTKLNITVYGKNWEDVVKDYENVIYKGEVSLTESMQLTKRAKIVINLNTNFVNGGHDRVFTGMLNQAVVFTDKSKYYDEYYEDKKDYLTYSFSTLDEDILKLKEYITDDKKLFDMANSAYNITKENHSWDERVKYLENMVSLAKIMNS